MESVDNKYKLDGHLITVPSGTSGGSIITQEVEVDDSYEEVVGVEAHEISNGGTVNGYYQIAIVDKDGAYVDMAHKNSILTSSAVDQRGKMRPINIPITTGRKIKVQTYWPTGALASNLQYEVVFTLRKKVASTR